ncbi:MAG: hypothetical protein OSA23_01805 [Rhodospirillales bacterium]|nr:hypothetical protein [Rhodospirillales bacterium]
MSDLLMNPGVQSSLIPLFSALVVMGLIRCLPMGAHQFLGLSVLVGFLVASYVTFGLPVLVPVASGQKIVYIAIISGSLGLVAQIFLRSGRFLLLTSLFGIILSFSWIGWKKIFAPVSMDHFGALLILAGCGMAAYKVLSVRHRNVVDTNKNDDLVVLAIVSIAIALNAFMGASASIAQNSGALAASLGAIILSNWVGLTVQPGPVTRFVPLIILPALLAQIHYFTKSNMWPLALLLLAFFTGDLAHRFVPISVQKSRFMRPIIIGAINTILAIASVAMSWAFLPVAASGY